MMIVEGHNPTVTSELLDSLVSFILKESGLCCEVPSPRPDTNFVYSGDDLLFSRGHWRGARYIQAKLLRVHAAEGVKFAAAMVGIDPKQVSTRSWRKGSITTLVSHGQSDEVVRRFGDHAMGSASTFLYQHETGQEARPLLFATKEGGLSVIDIQRVSRISCINFQEIEEGQSFVPLVSIENNINFTENLDGSVDDDSDSDLDSE